MGIYKDKRDKTKSALIEAFWDVYEHSDNFGEVSIKRVTEKAGVNRGTFYVHFEDIYSLLHEVQAQLLDSFSFQKMDNADFYHEEQLQQCINYMDKNRRYYLILLSEKGDPAFKAEVTNRLINIIYPSYFTENISHEKRFIIEYIAGGMMNATLYYLKHKDFSEKDMIASFCKLLSTTEGII